MDHFFVHCSVARLLWEFFFTQFGLKFNLSSGLYELFQFSFSVQNTAPELINLYCLFPWLISWTLWRLRNAIIFNRAVPQPSQIIEHVIYLLHSLLLKHPLPISQTMVSLQNCRYLPTMLKRRVVQRVVWSLPMLNVVAMDVNGSSVEHSSLASGGFILRDCVGHVFYARSEFFWCWNKLSC